MLQDRLGLSERRACQIAGQHRSTQRHGPRWAPDESALRGRLREISRERPRWGYRRAHARLREEGWCLNRKRTQRLWREEGLRVPQRRRKRQRLGESTVPASRLAAERPDQVWALDFQFDQTADGRLLKLLHVVDEFTREALAIGCERRIDADATVRVLDRHRRPRRRARAHPLRQRPRVDRERAPRLVPLQPGRQRLHRAGLALAERLRRVVRLPRARRAARGRTVPDPGRGPTPRRGLAPRLQHEPTALGAWHDGAGPLRRQLAAKRNNHQPTLIRGGPMNGVRSAALLRAVRGCERPCPASRASGAKRVR